MVLKWLRRKLRKKRGGRWPKIALSGTLWRSGSPYDEGFSSKENQKGWKVGFGIQIPIFNGFLTTNRIREASTRLEKMQEEQILLREGIALQIKNIFLKMLGYKKQLAAVGEAVRNAEENLDLNVRAYHAELVEVQDVIEAQLMESFMKALYQKALYSHAQAQFNIDFIVGCEVRGLL
jgi:outer membrane protein TolC